MLTGTNWDKRVLARLLDYFDAGTPWQRRLWTVGSASVLRELALMHREPGTFAPSRAAARSSGAQALGPDPGVGNATVRKRLHGLLNSDFHADEEVLREIDHLARDTRTYYLERWADALASGGVKLSSERASRLLAAHMLDAGPSPRGLHIWWRRWAIHEPQQFTLSQLLQRVDLELVRHSEEFRVIVLCQTVPTARPPGFVKEGDVPQWLTSLGLDPHWLKGRYVGGLQFTVHAPESRAAVAAVQAQIENFQARLVVGKGGRATTLAVHPQAQVVNGPRLRMSSRRKVEVHALGGRRSIGGCEAGDLVEGGGQQRE